MSIRFRRGAVRAVAEQDAHSQTLRVLLDAQGAAAPAEVLAYNDAALFGHLAPGDRVVLNATARELGLGTGGYDFVYWVESRSLPARAAARGHVMKLRYSPGQRRVLAAEEIGHPRRDRYLDAEAAGLEARPVVALGLHSELAGVVAGVRAAGRARVAYVHTDAGALPARFSRLVRRLRQIGALDRVVSAGHAYGGDVEAVSPASALLAAAAGGAQVVVAGTGPGIVGTHTRYGTSALEQAGLLDLAASLGGIPVASLRLSAADPRPRHRPLSHHALTALALTARAAWLVLPRAGEHEPLAATLAAARRRLLAAGLPRRHALVEVDGRPALRWLREAGVPADTMGRDAGRDPLPFVASGAAGLLAARLAPGA